MQKGAQNVYFHAYSAFLVNLSMAFAQNIFRQKYIFYIIFFINGLVSGKLFHLYPYKAAMLCGIIKYLNCMNIITIHSIEDDLQPKNYSK